MTIQRLRPWWLLALSFAKDSRGNNTCNQGPAAVEENAVIDQVISRLVLSSPPVGAGLLCLFIATRVQKLVERVENLGVAVRSSFRLVLDGFEGAIERSHVGLWVPRLLDMAVRQTRDRADFLDGLQAILLGPGARPCEQNFT